ncbi:GNAT family N-acetyltransferase [Staphylococcus chromogenes]|nr:GNAT family N-acetyltransferase [Staphylococcus chromogenes]
MSYYFAVQQLKDLSSIEVHEVYKLRVSVFVNEQNTAYQEVDDTDALPTTYHMLAWTDEEHKQLVGNIRIYEDVLDDGEHVMRLGRVCVTEEERGTGLAKALMKETIEFADQKFPDKNLVLDARTPLVGWYEKFGFRTIAEPYPFADITLTPMKKLH